MASNRILIIYHFFHPDSVISARLFSDLAESLADTPDNVVTVYTCNRLIRKDDTLPREELWNKVRIRRFSRPNFKQSSNVGRLLNSAILQLKWLMGFFRQRKDFDTVIIGTDPQFAYLMFPFMHWMNAKARMIHWAFDLYPEAILANSPAWMKVAAGLTKPLARFAYKFVDDMVDIGSCMRARLQQHHHHATCTTLPPWALVEPQDIPEPDPEIRKELFGDAKIGLLYSGTVGHAHDLTPFIQLARECRSHHLDIAFCFAGYGAQYKTQTAQLTPEDTNIRLAGFAPEAELGKRLAAADIHMISLRPHWTGIVVPSKFFGAIAIGRPVLFSGPQDSCLASWIKDYNLGYHLTPKTLGKLQKLAANPQNLQNMKKQAFKTYRERFSKDTMLQKWKQHLKH